MHFRLLGPLEVTDGNRSVVLGEGKQRNVLILLLLHRNEALMTDQLIDALWGDTPPRTAAKVLQNYVGQLRRALDDREGRRLQTRGHAYALRVAEGELDIDRFDELVDEGERALARERAADAAALLRQALALCRGPPLADVAYETFAQPEIARLEERRTSALEQRIEADLALGRHAHLVAELEALVAEHPLRERLRTQLMVALYRCGRQGDALEAYGDARRVLLDELGIEPGPALRELEAAILRQDPELAPRTRPWPRAMRAPRRRYALLAAGGLLVGVVVAAAALRGNHHEGIPARAGPNVVAAIDPADGDITDVVGVGASPSHLVVDGETLWVTNADGRSVSRVDLEDRTVSQTVPVGAGPAGLAVAAGAVWVANSRDGTVSRIDVRTSTVVQPVRVGTNPTGVAAGSDAVWVANSGEQTVSRIDPKTGHATTIDVHAQPTELAVGAGGVWMTSSAARTVSELDPRSGRVLAVTDVGGGPTGIAIGHGAVWVANSLDGTVSRINPKTAVISAVIPVGDGANAIAVGRDGIWVAEQFGHAVARIDPKTNRVVERIPIGSRPTGIALAGSRLWVGARDSGAAHRGGTLRVLGGLEAFDFIDPALAYSTGSIPFVAMTGDGLTGVQRAAGSDGTEIVPDLATTLPIPGDDGRSYRFRLRPDIRYSTGGLVRARDVRASFERMWKVRLSGKFTSPGRDIFDDIVGASRCTRAPATCDLSRGIVTQPGDESVVTFHLTRRDPEFLHKLTLPFAFVLPSGTPAIAADVRPVPATGPYMVATYQRGHRLVLTRNPQFREWSQAAQPAGYPDRIELRLDLPESRRVDSVLAGEADYTGGVQGGVPPRRVHDLLIQHAAQTHIEPLLTTIALALNTRVAPFDDVRVRRALNDAIDRRALVRAVGGSSAAAPTCQILPPNFPGYVRYCPYAAPDLRAARRLVARSGTGGMHVTIWSNRFLADGARPIVALLRRLGYDATLNLVPDADYFAKINDSRTRAQAGIVYWGADYTAPSNFLAHLLSCSAFQPASPNNLNTAEFCSPTIDARMRAASRMQAVNLQTANRRWAQVDRALVDAAPWVPLYNPRSVELLSQRAGGRQYNPLYGTLIDQLWVR